MSRGNQEWQALKKEYLVQIENNLSAADPDARRQILEDVDSHLRQRYLELQTDQHSSDIYQQIIRDMGSADSYLQYLTEETRIVQKTKSKQVIGYLCVIIGIGTILGFALKDTFRDYGKNAEMLSHQAWQQWRNGNYKEARSLFKRALKKEDQIPSAWNGLGWSCFHLGEFQNAEKAFLQCVKINEEFSGAWNGLGHLAHAQDQPEKAIEYWLKAINVSPAGIAAYLGLGQLYAEQKEYDKALALYEKWLEIEPDHTEIKAKYNEVLIQRGPPIVIKTSPEVFTNNVPPDLSEISVTFNQPMMNFSWSWVGSGEHYPEPSGEPFYDTARTTCTLPVKLQAGQWYWIGINSEYYDHFQTEKHIAAHPHVILFATMDQNGNPAEIPKKYIEEAKRINSKKEP